MIQQFEKNPMVCTTELLQRSAIPRSTYYYKRGEGLRGRKPSTMTVTQDGELVANQVVVQEVEAILQQ